MHSYILLLIKVVQDMRIDNEFLNLHFMDFNLVISFACIFQLGRLMKTVNKIKSALVLTTIVNPT